MMEKGNNKFINRAITCSFLFIVMARIVTKTEGTLNLLYVTSVDIAVPITISRNIDHNFCIVCISV